MSIASSLLRTFLINKLLDARSSANKQAASSGVFRNLMDSFSGNSSTTNAGYMDSLDNAITGNLDYQRSLETLEKEQSFNAAEAQKSRDFEEYMAKNSHQMEVADLEAAGINPYATLGSGASSYSAATASSGSAPNYNSGKGIGDIADFLKAMLQVNAHSAEQSAKLEQQLHIANDRMDLMQDAMMLKNAQFLNAQDLKASKLAQDLAIANSKQDLAERRFEFDGSKANSALQAKIDIANQHADIEKAKLEHSKHFKERERFANGKFRYYK